MNNYNLFLLQKASAINDYRMRKLFFIPFFTTFKKSICLISSIVEKFLLRIREDLFKKFGCKLAKEYFCANI